jgi:glutamate dehydrogenase (NAD(P)+)
MLAGIPIGGAKGAVSLSTSQYDRDEMLQVTSALIGPYVKQRKYFLGTDLGFSESDVDFLYRSAGSKLKIFSGGLAVGEACATGIASSLDYLQQNGICCFQARTVALEGFGRIGAPTAELLSAEGYRIVAVSNLVGTLHDPSGLNVSELRSTPSTSPDDILFAYAKNHPNSAMLPRDALAHIEAEILIPGARALVINGAVARQIKAKVVCPISNAPVTTDGEEALVGAGKISMPDIITNAGGLIASFAQHLGADISRTKKIISQITSRNLDAIFPRLHRNEVPKKMATAIALNRLRELNKSEKISTLRFLSPWIQALGLSAVLYGFKEYIDLKAGG